MATRYRPVHIHTLLLDAFPPDQLEEFFYSAETTSGMNPRSARSVIAKHYGLAVGSDVGADALLAEFHRGGYFLAEWIECPVSEALRKDSKALGDLIEALAPTVLHRVRFSYKPKKIALHSPFLERVAHFLREAGFEVTSCVLAA